MGDKTKEDEDFEIFLGVGVVIICVAVVSVVAISPSSLLINNPETLKIPSFVICGCCFAFIRDKRKIALNQ